ncbi:hypothetical protein C6361_24140 [Plantactinospora sp. BC1]|uniref:4'-phosphopantetheinyl transferase family protein n=1 Tax=Plantactinospora sp. BC1 TaxID=2108470 RepID=UPI000D15384D|nr:4'-phosphopantetheinyl transferase superfamily protein [Plantactinospora sp. BC1]AVT32056.1 hypothetical protein C6361_24140 [Plantactinospora sp. BC1]
MGPLGCDGDQVDLWALDLTAGADDVRRLTGLLDAAERERAARLAGALRRRFVVAHGLTRSVLGGYLDRAPHLVVLRRGRHGKPRLDGLEHNVSHHGDVALLAVTAYRPVGVDVADGPRPRSPEAFARRFFAPDEVDALLVPDPADRRRRFLRMWTRKEACVKADGARLRHGLRLRVDRTGTAAPTSGTVVPGGPAGLPGPWWVTDLHPPLPGTAAVAVRGDEPCRVAWRETVRVPRSSDWGSLGQSG